MNTSIRPYRDWMVLTLLGLLLGCQESFDNQLATAASPGQKCQLLAESSGPNGLRYAYAYHDNGLLLQRVLTTAGAAPTTDTYTYDAAGNLISILTQGKQATGDFTSTSRYDYADGRLITITSHSSSVYYSALNFSFSYDQTGRLATYTTSPANADSSSISQSYRFSEGQLSSSVLRQGSRALSLSVEHGHIVSEPAFNGSLSRYFYDADGYLTRSEGFSPAGVLQYYVLTEYSSIPFKRPNPPYEVIPDLDAYGIYGRRDLPPARVAVYNADGSLQTETTYQYGVNAQSYLTSTRSERKFPIGPSQTIVTTYSYRNCL